MAHRHSPTPATRSTPPAGPRGLRGDPRSFTTDAAESGLLELQLREAERRRYLETFKDVEIPDDFDEEDDSPSPIYDAYASLPNGNSVRDMCNFTQYEFDVLWASIAAPVSTAWRNHRGPQCQHTAKDVFFMMCSTFKTGGKWPSVAKPFQAVPGTFQKMITKFIRIVSPLLYEAHVAGELNDHPMDMIINTGRGFQKYPCARYATDVTFQQTNEPTHGQEEYYSAQHELHGLKVEVSVSPLGRAVNCTDAYPGMNTDISIFRRNSDFHEQALRKSSGFEMAIPDEGTSVHSGSQAHPDTWAVLVGKRYVGLQSDYRTILPAKRPKQLSPLQNEVNRTISDDDSIVKKFLGRICTLWLIAQERYRWNRELYSHIFKALVALTNYHVSISPLHADDGQARRLYEQRLYALGTRATERRRRGRKPSPSENVAASNFR